MAYGRVDGTNAPKPEEDNSYGDSDFYSKSIKPDLTVLDGNKSKKAAKANEASKDLSDAEKNAVSNPIAKTGAGAASVLGAEAGGSFINNVRGLTPGKKKSGVSAKLKKGGPIGVIVGLFLALTGSFFFGGQSLMPFSLVAQFIGNFDSMGVSTSLRSRSFLRWQTNGGLTKDCVHTTFFNKHKFKITSKQSTKLKAEGIEEVEIGGKTFLALDDGSPQRTLIAPDDKIAKSVGDGVTGPGGEKFGKTLSFDDAYSKLPDFRNGYNKASRTWKGSVGSWFDNLTLRFLNNIDTSRNKFLNFRKRVEEAQAGNTKSAQAAELEVAKADMSKGADEVSGNLRAKQYGDAENEDGSRRPSKSDLGDDQTTLKAGMSPDEIKTKVKKAAAVANGAQAGANAFCAIAGIIGTVSILAAAAETLQIVKLISGFTEAIQKTQYGDGVDSPIHALSQSLVTNTNTKSWSLSDNGKIITDDDIDVSSSNVDFEMTEYTTKENVSAMQSAGIAAIFGNTPIDQNDPSAQSFNITGRFDNILAKLGASAGSFMACTAAKLATAAISATAAILGIIFTGGIANALKEAVGSVAGVVAIGVGVAVAVKFLVPKAVSMLSRDLVSDLAGEDLGNALVSGANLYMSSNHRSGGGSLTDKDGLLAYAVEHEKVIADEAEYERSNRSPFDITSQYTFLGSLLTKFSSFYTMSSSTAGLFTTIGNITKNSLSSLLPSASAVTAAKMIESTGKCPYLEAIGAVGDAYCNPYIVTDVKSKTIDENPIDVIDTVANLGENFEGQNDNGAPKIKKDSNLAYYVQYCSERTSSFGFADQNISAQFQSLAVNTGSDVVDAGTDALIGAIPVAGDAIDVLNNIEVAKNAGWITGESCVAGNTSNNGGLSSTPDWYGEGEYYQRFLEDQRYMESIDPNYTSSEVAFLDEYYAEHPLDDSYEGVLARYSGLTKETVVGVLDAVEYLNYIADYDPSTRYVFTNNDNYTQKTYVEDNNNVASDSETVVTQYAIIYNDIRNRTATV